MPALEQEPEVPSRARADLEQQERTARGPPHRLKRGEASGQSGSPEDGHEALWRNCPQPFVDPVGSCGSSSDRIPTGIGRCYGSIRRITVDVVFVKDVLRDRIRRSVEPTFGRSRSAIGRATQFKLAVPDRDAADVDRAAFTSLRSRCLLAPAPSG
jgi:hypothetical protein